MAIQWFAVIITKVEISYKTYLSTIYNELMDLNYDNCVSKIVTPAIIVCAFRILKNKHQQYSCLRLQL